MTPAAPRVEGSGAAATPSRRTGSRRGTHGARGRETRWVVLFLAPTLIGLAVLSAGPILATLGLSLTKWDMLSAPQVVGLDNYTRLLGDDRFQKALRNTLFYTLVSVPVGLVFALGLATALNRQLRGIA